MKSKAGVGLGAEEGGEGVLEPTGPQGGMGTPGVVRQGHSQSFFPQVGAAGSSVFEWKAHALSSLLWERIRLYCKTNRAKSKAGIKTEAC